MGRGMQIAMLGAVVVGGVAGGLVAVAVSAAPPQAIPRAPAPAPSKSMAPPSTPSPVAAAPVAAAPVAPSPVAPSRPAASPLAITTATAADSQAALTAAMTAILTRFAAWARDHTGEPCPDAATLGPGALDPWGHPFELTCTDQPAEQKIGVVSAGPDGIAGNADDIASWSFGRSVTDLVRGARWRPAQPDKAVATRKRPNKRRTEPPARGSAAASVPAAPAPAAPAPAISIARPPQPPAASPGPGAPLDAGSDDIPMRR